MFKIKHRWLSFVYTVYGVDRTTNTFLVAESWGDFDWVPIDDYRLYEEDLNGD